MTDFSRRFSAALQGVMRENKVRIDDVVVASGRSKGFVSEHTNGTAAPDTDLLDAIAGLIGVDTRDLVTEVARRSAPTAQDDVIPIGSGRVVRDDDAGVSAPAPNLRAVAKRGKLEGPGEDSI